MSKIEYGVREQSLEREAFKRNWEPYQQDLTLYPEIFKKTGENFDKIDQLNQKFKNEDPFTENHPGPYDNKKPLDFSPWEKKYDDFIPKF